MWISHGYIHIIWIYIGYVDMQWISIECADMWISLGYLPYIWIYLDIFGYIRICEHDSLTAAARFRSGVGWGEMSDIHTRYWKFNYLVWCQCRRSACLKRHFLVSNGQL